MDLNEMTTDLRNKIGKPSTTEVPNSELWDHINEAYVDLATRYKHFGNRLTTGVVAVADTDSIGFSGEIGAIMNVQLGVTKKFLRRITLSGIARYASTPKGRPVAWMRWRNGIRVFPTPDANYALTIYHKMPPTRLTEGSQTPDLPTDWHKGIVFKARWYYWDSKEDAAKAAMADNSFRLWVADKPSELEEEVGFLDAAVELPELAKGYGSRWYGPQRYDDGTFDYRE